MGHLQTLFEQYKAEVENECSWTSFKGYIPFNVKKMCDEKYPELIQVLDELILDTES